MFLEGFFSCFGFGLGFVFCFFLGGGGDWGFILWGFVLFFVRMVHQLNFPSLWAGKKPASAGGFAYPRL